MGIMGIFLIMGNAGFCPSAVSPKPKEVDELPLQQSEIFSCIPQPGPDPSAAAQAAFERQQEQP